MPTETIQAPPPTQRLPVGIGNAFACQIFNTLSVTLLLGTPMVLWFKQTGASATQLGILAALSPLLSALQVPAARFLNRVGYRKFVSRGWITGTALILGILLVSLLSEAVSTGTRLMLMLIILIGFNTARGIAQCGLLPWMTHLVPESVRGRFVSFDMLSASISEVALMLLTGWYLGAVNASWRFGLLFVVSFVMALGSVVFLRKIPDVPVPAEEESRGRVRWKELFEIPSCRAYLIFNLFMGLAFSAWGTFWIPLLRDLYGTSDTTILQMMALWSAVLVVCVFSFGRIVDRVGSRPLLGVALGVFVVYCFALSALAARILPYHWGTLVFIQVVLGLASSLYNLSLSRLLMGTVPKAGGSQIFAMMTVINCLMNGTLPILWGMGIDGLTNWHVQWGQWHWNNYSALYCLLAVIMAAGQYFRRRLHEPGAMGTNAFLREFFVMTSTRAMSLWGFRRPPRP